MTERHDNPDEPREDDVTEEQPSTGEKRPNGLLASEWSSVVEPSPSARRARQDRTEPLAAEESASEDRTGPLAAEESASEDRTGPLAAEESASEGPTESPAAERSASGLLDSEWSSVGRSPTDPPPSSTSGADERPGALAAVDLTSLVGGLCLIAVGTLLVLETKDVIDLTLGYVWPALLAAAGATLLASGLRKGRR